MTDISPEPQVWKAKPITAWHIFSAIASVVIVTVLIVGGLTKASERDEILDNGTKTTAQPTGKATRTTSGPNGNSPRVHLEYRFLVDGVTYTALGDQSYRTRTYDRNAAMRANKNAEVWYLPDDPHRAVVLDVDYR